MPKAAVDKVIVTHRAALQAKYGAGYASRIKPALAALVAADQARGLVTRIVHLDVASEMKKFAAPPVTSAGSRRQHKAAIDGVFAALRPAYLCILGAVDVVPHQDLANPIASDGDPIAWSDLPYACAGGYSKRIDAFLDPTRVVGRLPDVTGATDPQALVAALAFAAKLASRPAGEYDAYLGLGAKVWSASTAQSLRNVFGNDTALQSVPPAHPPWADIARRAHFINCHGATADPHFYGQQGSKYPVAHDATLLAGLAEGTVASAECCYGAELYDPALAAGQAGICNTYLRLGACAFFGSSTIAYGPATGNGQADLLCQYFLREVRDGASTGEAAWKARLAFVQQLAIADPTDLKTLAQFSLMGDPSLHPVAAVPHRVDDAVTPPPKAAGTSAKGGDVHGVRAASRRVRRAHLAALGAIVADAVAVADVHTRDRASPRTRTLLEAELQRAGARCVEVAAFAVRPPAAAKGKRLPVAAARVAVAVGELPRDAAPFPRWCVVVARETADGTVLRRVYSR
jgi:hypothetical protein